MTGIIKAECSFNFNYISLLAIALLSFAIIDRSGIIRKQIVEDFEGRTNGRGGDLFFQYPPENISDIYFKISLIMIIFAAMVFVNLI